jgi:hypothetical protein
VSGEGCAHPITAHQSGGPIEDTEKFKVFYPQADPPQVFLL